MAQTFTAQIDAWCSKVEARREAVFKQSAQDVIDAAQVPTAKGGRMRVDTGFLRASGRASTSGLPGLEENPYTEPNSVNWADDDVSLVIAGARPGQPIFFGWAANYARIRESYDGFRAHAALQWQAIVKRNVAKAKARFR